MPNITVSLPDDLKQAMSRHKEVNWSAVIRRAIQNHLHKITIADAIASKSRLSPEDADEIDRLVKKGIAERHGLQ